MGKGDRKTRRGKVWAGTYGKARPHRKPGQGKQDKQDKPQKKVKSR